MCCICLFTGFTYILDLQTENKFLRIRNLTMTNNEAYFEVKVNNNNYKRTVNRLESERLVRVSKHEIGFSKNGK